jgi:hypothetical protein
LACHKGAEGDEAEADDDGFESGWLIAFATILFFVLA